MKVRRFAIVALAAASVAVPVGACSGEDTDATSSTTTTTTSAPPRNFQVSTPDGQVSLSLDGQLPPGWPTDFPVPDGAEPAGSGSIGDAESTVRVGVFTTTETGHIVRNHTLGIKAPLHHLIVTVVTNSQYCA